MPAAAIGRPFSRGCAEAVNGRRFHLEPKRNPTMRCCVRVHSRSSCWRVFPSNTPQAKCACPRRSRASGPRQPHSPRQRNCGTLARSLAQDDSNVEVSRRDWWRDQWLNACNADAIEVLAAMDATVYDVDLNARTPKPPFKPYSERTHEWEEPEPHLRTAVSLAAERGDAEAIRVLAQLGCVLDTPDSTGHSPAHYAAEGGKADCLSALLAAGGVQGGGLDAVDGKYGATPLILACGSGYGDAVQVLVDAGVNVHHVDQGNATAAGWCRQRGNRELLAIVLAAAGPSGCRKAVRGDKRFRIKQKELRAQLEFLLDEQLVRVAKAWGMKGAHTTAADLMKFSNR
ncbi:hypothetical protein CYMTET_50999 [Cymbomonas tetramitiformis]|uniref:Uncharacterized protein n=1 Tax=Cymbomonas tetramitiformis TaxID=36881 RepID=A0AAE0ET34_9CHLO|nr:hypothetical protein CYMTET_50999 [Cymbomonas tetramitiformis]